MALLTQQIIEEFLQQIDIEKEYELKELKQILGEVYKTKTKKPKTTKEPKQPKNESDSKADKPVKPKRAASGYNKYIKQRIETLKAEQPEKHGKQLLIIAAGEWKQLSKQEQDQYKN